MLLDLLAESGSTILFSSHILSDVERVATDIVILHKGRIILNQPIDQLKEQICRVEVTAPAGLNHLPIPEGGAYASRRKNNQLIAVLPCGPSDAPAWLASRVQSPNNLEVISASPISLEDLFIEMTGELS